MKKAQLVSIDFIPALFIFLGIFIGALLSWNSIVNYAEDISYANEMSRITLSATDSLVRGQGIPAGWNPSNVKVIGLSDGRPNMLQESSVYAFLSLNYTVAQRLLGIPYDFSVDINGSSGSAFTVNGTPAIYGIAPNNADNVAVVTRIVMLAGQPGKLTMRVWS